MKRLALLVAVLLVTPMLVASCTPGAPSPPHETESVSSCVTCHTDKDMLKQTATVVQEEQSEATSGEG